MVVANACALHDAYSDQIVVYGSRASSPESSEVNCSLKDTVRLPGAGERGAPAPAANREGLVGGTQAGVIGSQTSHQ